MKGILDQRIVMLAAWAVLALALVFFSWVLQLPSQNPAPVAPQPPATGVVAVNVVSPPTQEAAPVLDETSVEPCSGLPDGSGLKQDCLQSVQPFSSNEVPPSLLEPSSPCEGVPEGLKAQCLQDVQPAASDGFSPSEAVPCDGLPEELKQQCLSSLG